MLHPVEVSIFYSLRHGETTRFADLMRPTDLTSDDFKFYLKRLVDCGWVQKMPAGGYRLTLTGKELANNLDNVKRTQQKQPKLSVVVIAQRTVNGKVEYVFQRRSRQPYLGRWGLLSGPVAWGESFEQAAVRELTKQTGLAATCTVRSFARVVDVLSDGDLLEDKLFALVVAADITGELTNDWHGGQNAWLTLEQLESQSDYFLQTRALLELVRSGQAYGSFTSHYEFAEY
jgi:ADP-ribose pyrophosphatase YjhB (NUDIX family)